MRIFLSSPQSNKSIGVMLRSGSPGFLVRSSLRFISSSSRHPSSHALAANHSAATSHSLSLSRPRSLALALHKPSCIPFLRHASNQPAKPVDHIDKAEEKAIGKERLEPHPEEVSTVSTVHQVFHEKAEPPKAEEPEEEDVDMLAGVKSDFVSRWIPISHQGFH